MPSMIERLGESYWNAFRAGYIAVGGNPAAYPTWQQSTDPVKNETLRCLRHAVEELISPPIDAIQEADKWLKGRRMDEGDEARYALLSHSFNVMHATMFPDPPVERRNPKADHDDKFTTSMKIAEIGR